MARFLFSAKCLQMNAKGCNFASAKLRKECNLLEMSVG